MFKRCLVFVLTILCLLFSLGCGSDGGSSAQQTIEKKVSQITHKTYFNAKEFDMLSVDDLKATVEEIDKMPKSNDSKTALKNEAIKTVALEYIEKNQSVARNLVDILSNQIVERKSSVVASDVKIIYFYDYDGAGHLGVRAQFKLQNVSKKSLLALPFFHHALSYRVKVVVFQHEFPSLLVGSGYGKDSRIVHIGYRSRGRQKYCVILLPRFLC